MQIDQNMLCVIVGVLVMPIIIIMLARQLKKIKDMRAEKEAGGGGAGESSDSPSTE